MVNIQQYYETSKDKIKREIENTAEEEIIYTNKDELVNYYFNKYKLPLIEIDSGKNEEVKKEKSENYGYRDYYVFTLTVPIIPNEKNDTVLSLQSSKHGGITPTNYKHDNSSISVTKESLKEEKQIKEAILKVREGIIQLIKNKNDDIKSGNPILKIWIEEFISYKQECLKKEYQEIEKACEEINVKLIKRDSKEIPEHILKPKKTLELIKPKPKIPRQDASIKKEQVEEVIRLIESQAKTFEQTPKVYNKLEEEDLRDILLSTLNAVFQNNATGESFNKKGKTDIRLVMPNTELLIIEIKKWAGEKKYIEAIKQLIGYMTCRESWVILLTFSNMKNFTEIMQKAKNASKQHPDYIKSSLSENRFPHSFNTTHTLTHDKGKKAIIYHLFYDIHP